MEPPERELFWEQLLEYVAEGRVIPILGQDLLTVSTANGPQKLYSLLALQLALRLEVDAGGLDADDALNRVACRYLAKRGDVATLYPLLKGLLPQMEKLSIPEPLLKLAEIEPFRVFVTTTFDSMMYRALVARRPSAKAHHVKAYSPARTEDLPVIEPDSDVVFHLFGKLSSVPEYAVTEEDVLEFIHSLGSESRRPRRLFEELSEKHLLLIGSCCPDWLVRFFIRVARRERLRISGGKNDFLIDPKVTEDSGLVVFLKNFSTHTQVFAGGDACSFVDELHRRWMARQQQAKVPAPRRRRESSGSGKVFLSYAHEDEDIAQRICAELEALKVRVFFDRSDIRNGDQWQPVAENAIRNSAVFVPIISKHNLVQGARPFRGEWVAALATARLISPTRRFITPLIIDETKPAHPDIAPYFGALSIKQIPAPRWADGTGDAEVQAFVKDIRSIYRQHKKEALV